MARSTYNRLAALAAFAFVSFIAGCDSTTATDLESVLRDSKAPAVKVSKITLAPSPVNLSVGDSAQVAVTLLNAAGDSITSRTVKWSSYDPTVATVDAEGKVAALKTGYSIVYAKLDGVTGWATVTVAGHKSDKAKAGGAVVGSLTVSPATLELSESDKAVQLSATAKDSKGKALGAFDLRWTSSDSSIVRVDSAGLVVPVGAGTAHVIAKAGSKADTAHVVVKAHPGPPASLKITPDVASLGVGETVALEARLSGSKASLNCVLAWKSLTPAVASVNADGRLVGHSAGTAKIVASCGAAADTVSVTVHAHQGGLAGIDATGRTDVTEKLNAYFASVPDGSTIRFPRNAKYRIDYTLEIEGRHNLTFEGNGALFFTDIPGPYGYASGSASQLDKRNRTRMHWLVVRSSGITFRNLTVRGANRYAGVGELAYNASFEAQHGFNIAGSEDVLIENVTITDVWGDFVDIAASQWRERNSGPFQYTWSRGVVVRNNHFDRNGRQGISITAGQDVRIEGNYIGNVRRSSVDLEPNGTRDGAKRVMVRGNTFGPSRLGWITSGNSQGVVEDITVEDNQVRGRPIAVLIRPRTGRRANIRIINNASDTQGSGSGDGMIYLLNVDGIEVRGNYNALNPKRKMTGVYVEGSCGVVVKENRFPGAAHDARILPYSGCR